MFYASPLSIGQKAITPNPDAEHPTANTARSRSSVAASSSLTRTVSDCPKKVFSLLTLCAKKSERQNTTPRHDGHSLGWAVSSMLCPDHFAHHLAAGGLQWSHAAPGQEPHAFVLVAAVHNVNAI